MSFRLKTEIPRYLVIAFCLAVSIQITHLAAFPNPPVLNLDPASGLKFSPKPIFPDGPTFQEKDIHILVNYYRKKNKMRPMKWDRKLAKLARFYSKKMAQDNFFEHTDKEGKTVVERADDFKIKGWRKLGENLFYSKGLVSPSSDAVESWLESPGHRVNILDSDWTHTAIGVYEESHLVTYITQVFMEK